VNFTHNNLEGQRFPSSLETAAYRIVQEALTNVARHAGVKEVSVIGWSDPDILSVEIHDQGKGFDPQAALDANNSNGVAGMGERARLLGGGLTIESDSETGTRIIATLPLGQEVS
jgi:signal transduction histidine kinase